MKTENIDNKIKDTINKLSSLCQVFQEANSLNLDEIKDSVECLSQEMTAIDLASHQHLKSELLTLNGLLGRLAFNVQETQDHLSHRLEDINSQQRTFHAFASVANNNFSSAT